MLLLVINFLMHFQTEKIQFFFFFFLATGAAALMAIRVLLDHNVPQEKIALLSLLVSKQGKI